MLPNIFQSKFFVDAAVAGIIIFSGFIVAHFFSRAVGLIIKKFDLTEKIKKIGVKNPSGFLESAIRYIIYALAIIAALNRLGIFKTVFSIIVIIIAAIAIIVLFLNFRDFIANAAAGISIYGRHKFKLGQKIKVGEIEGKIQSVSITGTKIITEKGEIIVFPNTFLLKSKVEIIK